MHVMMRMEFDRIDHVAFTVRRRRVARLHEKIASVRRNVQHQTGPHAGAHPLPGPEQQ
jgi:hypothetical protein